MMNLRIMKSCFFVVLLIILGKYVAYAEDFYWNSADGYMFNNGTANNTLWTGNTSGTLPFNIAVLTGNNTAYVNQGIARYHGLSTTGPTTPNSDLETKCNLNILDGAKMVINGGQVIGMPGWINVRISNGTLQLGTPEGTAAGTALTVPSDVIYVGCTANSTGVVNQYGGTVSTVGIALASDYVIWEHVRDVANAEGTYNLYGGDIKTTGYFRIAEHDGNTRGTLNVYRGKVETKTLVGGNNSQTNFYLADNQFGQIGVTQDITYRGNIYVGVHGLESAGTLASNLPLITNSGGTTNIGKFTSNLFTITQNGNAAAATLNTAKKALATAPTSEAVGVGTGFSGAGYVESSSDKLTLFLNRDVTAASRQGFIDWLNTSPTSSVVATVGSSSNDIVISGNTGNSILWDFTRYNAEKSESLSLVGIAAGEDVNYTWKATDGYLFREGSSAGTDGNWAGGVSPFVDARLTGNKTVSILSGTARFSGKEGTDKTLQNLNISDGATLIVDGGKVQGDGSWLNIRVGANGTLTIGPTASSNVSFNGWNSLYIGTEEGGTGTVNVYGGNLFSIRDIKLAGDYADSKTTYKGELNLHAGTITNGTDGGLQFDVSNTGTGTFNIWQNGTVNFHGAFVGNANATTNFYAGSNGFGTVNVNGFGYNNNAKINVGPGLAGLTSGNFGATGTMKSKLFTISDGITSLPASVKSNVYDVAVADNSILVSGLKESADHGLYIVGAGDQIVTDNTGFGWMKLDTSRATQAGSYDLTLNLSGSGTDDYSLFAEWLAETSELDVAYTLGDSFVTLTDFASDLSHLVWDFTPFNANFRLAGLSTADMPEVPEPSAILLLLLGLCFLLLKKR